MSLRTALGWNETTRAFGARPSGAPFPELSRDSDRSVSRRETASFADAEPREDHAEQVVGRELARDRRKRVLRFAELFGEELERRSIGGDVRASGVEMHLGGAQCHEMTRARDERVLLSAFDAGQREHLLFE